MCDTSDLGVRGTTILGPSCQEVHRGTTRSDRNHDVDLGMEASEWNLGNEGLRMESWD